ncbi:MAG: hypothetical protein ACQEP6_01115 [Patescibacteria group bacterium]
MFSLIERLQNKPRHKRKLIALSFSAGFTFFIFIFWASGMYLYGDPSSVDDSPERDASPFRVINRNISSFVGAVGETFSDANKVLDKNNVYEFYENSENSTEKEESIKNSDKEKSEESEVNKERVFDVENKESHTEEEPAEDSEENLEKGESNEEYKEEEF